MIGLTTLFFAWRGWLIARSAFAAQVEPSPVVAFVHQASGLSSLTAQVFNVGGATSECLVLAQYDDRLYSLQIALPQNSSQSAQYRFALFAEGLPSKFARAQLLLWVAKDVRGRWWWADLSGSGRASNHKDPKAKWLNDRLTKLSLAAKLSAAVDGGHLVITDRSGKTGVPTKPGDVGSTSGPGVPAT